MRIYKGEGDQLGEAVGEVITDLYVTRAVYEQYPCIMMVSPESSQASKYKYDLILRFVRSSLDTRYLDQGIIN